MSYADRIRQARSQPEAMLIIAEGIDEILSSRPAERGDEWSAWPGTYPDEGKAPATPSTELTPGTAIDAPVDEAALEQARNDLAALEANFERVRNGGTQAMIHQAAEQMQRAQARVRLFENPGQILVPRPKDDVIKVTYEGDTVTVDLPPPDEARREARRALAESIDLPGFFPPAQRTDREGILHAFEHGGPLWLAAIGSYDGSTPIIKQLPHAVKHAMVADVQIDSASAAEDFSHYAFYMDDDEGTTLDIASSNIDSVTATGGTPYRGSD